MARVIVTETADRDTTHIFADLAGKAGKSVAARYDSDFDRIYDRLAEYPESGAPRPRLGRHIRICVVPPYIVIYEFFESDETVLILRIVHGRRKLTRKFMRDS